MINLIHPYIENFVLDLPINFKFIFSAIISVLYAIELTIIVVAGFGVRRALEEIASLWDIIKEINPDNIPNFREYMEDLEEQNIEWYRANEADISEEFLKKYDFTLGLDNADYEDEENLLRLRLSQLIEEKFTQRNIYEKILYRVFPDLKTTNHQEIFEVMRDTYLDK